MVNETIEGKIKTAYCGKMSDRNYSIQLPRHIPEEIWDVISSHLDNATRMVLFFVSRKWMSRMREEYVICNLSEAGAMYGNMKFIVLGE